MSFVGLVSVVNTVQQRDVIVAVQLSQQNCCDSSEREGLGRLPHGRTRISDPLVDLGLLLEIGKMKSDTRTAYSDCSSTS